MHYGTDIPRAGEYRDRGWNGARDEEDRNQNQLYAKSIN